MTVSFVCFVFACLGMMITSAAPDVEETSLERRVTRSKVRWFPQEFEIASDIFRGYYMG